jgi:hypothetical protein
MEMQETGFLEHLTPSPFPGFVVHGDRSSLALAPSSLTVAGGKAGRQSRRSTIKSGDRTKRIPLVILTSSKKEVDLVSRYTLGANRCLQKPVDSPQFRQSLTAVAWYWRLTNQPPLPNRAQPPEKKAP